jgi:hypothetical protein
MGSGTVERRESREGGNEPGSVELMGTPVDDQQRKTYIPFKIRSLLYSQSNHIIKHVDYSKITSDLRYIYIFHN